MHKVLIFGAGNIGSLVACLLAQTEDYEVYLADIKQPNLDINPPLPNLHLIALDATHADQIKKICQQHNIQILVSCLSYYHNVLIAQIAKELKLHYFDLTEDVEVAEHIKQLAKTANTVFMPRCGLAPGFINILANDLMQHFERLDTVELRVGNLPININNALRYALSWSTDGLINEYGNICYGIVEGNKLPLQPLEDLETVEIDGMTYEAFNTSGGIASLIDTYASKVSNLNYKTLRYPGHCEKMRFLMKDLKLNDDRPTLKRILENVLPKTNQDVALVYVAITGIKQGQLMNETYANKIYPQVMFDKTWAAIQVTTASALCASLDIVINNLKNYCGLVLQEQILLNDFLANRFGIFFRKQK